MTSEQSKKNQRIQVTKELFWEASNEGCRLNAAIMGYTSATGESLLGVIGEPVFTQDETGTQSKLERLIRSDLGSKLIHSSDNGRTWREGESLVATRETSDVVTDDYLDVENDVHMYFILRRVMDLAKLAGRHGMTYSQQLYRDVPRWRSDLGESAGGRPERRGI